MSFVEAFKDHVKTHQLFEKKDLLILAVSGGADSVALCELCQLADFKFEIAHCNFQLRGEESDRDENFVRELAERYGVSFHLKKFDTDEYSKEKNVSIQVAARELRYQWFNELLKEKEQPSYLLTAHHANDNIETLLMNFFKGTGIRGLQGIPAKHEKIRRPLLFASKAQILDFLKKQNLSFVEDSSNLSDKYTRNFFRNQLIPEIQKVFPQVEENLTNNLERFNEIAILYDQSLEFHKKKLLEFKGNEVEIPVLLLLKTKPLKTILFEILRNYNFSSAQTDDVIHLLKSETGKFVASSTHKIFKNRNKLVISPIESNLANHIIIEKDEKKIQFRDHVLTIVIKEWNDGNKISSDKQEVLVDASKIEFPLLLRKWKQGDYFYPLGMEKKKKLSRFFTDQKLSLSEKENTWILESDKRIVWIVGQRIDNRFRVQPNTKEILELKVQLV